MAKKMTLKREKAKALHLVFPGKDKEDLSSRKSKIVRVKKKNAILTLPDGQPIGVMERSMGGNAKDTQNILITLSPYVEVKVQGQQLSLTISKPPTKG